MKDKSKLTAIILVIITIIVLVISFMNKKNEESTTKPEIVKNYSDFYTVDTCLYRTISYIVSKDSDSLMLLLNDKYKKKNNITKENITKLFPELSEGATFSSKKMYYEKLTSNIIKYYVYGYIEETEFQDGYYEQNINNTEIYFIVYLDTSNNIYSIEPYDGNIFLKS